MYGGWKSDNVLKQVYRRAIDEERQKMSNIANEHFDKMFDESQKK